MDKGDELDTGRPFPLITGFTPIIGPFAHLSATFGRVEGGNGSLGGVACPDDRTGGWGDGDLDLDSGTCMGCRLQEEELEGGGSVGEGEASSSPVGWICVGNADP